MTNDIEPMVPVMPQDTSTDQMVADGGRRMRFERPDADAPLVPEY